MRYIERGRKGEKEKEGEVTDSVRDRAREGVYENGANEVVMTEIMLQKKQDHQICSIKSPPLK